MSDLASVAALLAGIAGTVASSPFVGNGIPDTPRIDVSETARPGYEIFLVDREGVPMGRAVSPGPVPVDLSALPDHLLNAVIAAEDVRFLEHMGVDPVGTSSALRDTLRGRLRGGSGIAQQMVKNTRVGGDVSLGRKSIEAMLAVRATERLGRREVLRRYLQSAWLGRGTTGIMPAARTWFGKSWDEVSLAESATLAAMLKGPSRYDPALHPERVKARRNAILDIMAQEGWADAEDVETAKAEPVVAVPDPAGDVAGTWATSAAEADLASRTGLPGRGRATLTIEPGWQEIAEDVLAEATAPLPRIAPRRLSATDLAALSALAGSDGAKLPARLEIDMPAGSPYRSTLLLSRDDDGWDVLTAWGVARDVKLTGLNTGWSPEPGDVVPALPVSPSGEAEVHLPSMVQGAVVVMDPRTGDLLASVGGVDRGLTSFDRTRALRQPGSAIKPFLWLAAIDAGFLPSSAVQNSERTYWSNGVSWRPRNYDLSETRPMPMFMALERSSNLAAAWIADTIGIGAMASMAEAAGVYPPGGMRRVLPSSLGATETTLLDLVAGYAGIVNDAIPRRPRAVEEIEGVDGRTALLPIVTGKGPISSAGDARDLVGMLRGVVVRGTASAALGDHPVTFVGKTGTTQGHRDAWFIGMTPHVALGVWLGRDDAGPLPGRMAGGSDAAPVAGDILEMAFDAGLIGANGYRDDRMTSGMPWPPALHNADATPVREPVYDVMPRPRGSSGVILEGWGIVDDQRREGRSRSGVQVDRNGDLLDDRW